MTLEVLRQEAVDRLYEKMMASSAVKKEDVLLLRFLGKVNDFVRELNCIELHLAIREFLQAQTKEGRVEKAQEILEYLYDLLDTSKISTWAYKGIREAIENGKAYVNYVNFVENR